MKISYRWLQELIDLSESAANVADVLTAVGLEVEGVETFDPYPFLSDRVVIGEVLEAAPHPRADKLRVTRVDVGAETPLQIVCGAPNVAKGQKVAVAMVGAAVRNIKGESLTLKKTKLRGEVSEGMIVAESEIGVGDDDSGIWVLPADAPTGTAVREWMAVRTDHILEVAITPNRGDAASHWGVARDLSAYYDRPMKRPPMETPPAGRRKAQIHLPQPAACPRYAGLGIENVRPIPSPRWLQERLRAVGMQPRNLLVDLTNYVLMELGQPLHAFDWERLPEPEIAVDFARKGERIEALDGKEYELSEDVLTIRSGGMPVAVAGVIGGSHHSVSENTQTIFLESAYFDPKTIRRGARRLGIATDASFRFERGTDPHMVVPALQRYWTLLKQYLPEARVFITLTDVYPAPIEPAQIDFSLDIFEKVVGMPIEPERARRILHRLGFEGAAAQTTTWRLTVPPAKHDVQRPVDVVEELLRIEGQDRVPIPDRVHFPLPVQPLDPAQTLRRRWEAFLIGQGFLETYHNSIVDVRWLEEAVQAADRPPVRLLNPLNQELNALRNTMLFPGLLTIQHNIRHGHDRLRLWEWGHIYWQSGPQQYQQRERMALWTCGKRHRPTIHHPPLAADFFYLKGVLEALFQMAGLSWTLTEEKPSMPIVAHQVVYTVNGKKVGELMNLSLKMLAKYQIELPVAAAEIAWETVAALVRQRKVTYRPFGRYPVVERDLAVLMPRTTPWRMVRDAVMEAAPPTLQDVFVFDIYEGDRLPPDRKSVAFRLRFYDSGRTLQEKQIDRAMRRIMETVRNIPHVEIRR